jgi:hypothetical protein
MTRFTIAMLTCLVALAACGDAPRPSMPAGLEFHVTPLAIGDSERLGPLRLRGAVAMQSRDESFGSYSGLHVSDNGTSLVAIGWGGWLMGRLRYGPAGDLAGFQLDGVFPLRDEAGRPIADDADKDAESLVERDGYYYVGFETNSRVARYRGLDAAAEPVHLPPEELAAIPQCCGFSSVVFTARHELLALTEGVRDPEGNVKGWLWQDGRPEAIWLRSDARWLPVDLALLPDGDLLLVEVREDFWSDRWHSRFSRVAAADVRAGAVMPAKVLGELYSADHPDRIEGIHAYRGSSGETLVYAVSDSRRGWPTSLLVFELVEQAGG